MKDYILEVCVDSVESALAARAGGATRLELCANLVIGGTTPGYALFDEVKRETGLPIRTLIRPRFGDFLYTDYEYEQMIYDIRHFSKEGADGVVIGSLNADGTLNEAQMRGMIESADGCRITFHRAFDVCADPIVTKLGEKEAITVMVGAGVNSGNIVQLAKETTAHAFHMSGKKVLPSGMQYRNERVHMGIEGMSEFEIYRTDAEEVRKAAEQLRSIS